LANVSRKFADRTLGACGLAEHIYGAPQWTQIARRLTDIGLEKARLAVKARGAAIVGRGTTRRAVRALEIRQRR
jgi:hypothetical protein